MERCAMMKGGMVGAEERAKREIWPEGGEDGAGVMASSKPRRMANEDAGRHSIPSDGKGCIMK